MKFTQSLAIAMLVLCLAGCVLQSETPAFKESEGSALPEALGARFTSETFTDGKWKQDDGTISFKAEDKHYVASNSSAKDTIEVLFVKLGPDSWVMQAAEKGKPSAYVLAEAKDSTLLLQPLLCDDLKKQAEAATLVRFDGLDCFLKSAGDANTFKALKTLSAPARMRLVPAK